MRRIIAVTASQRLTSQKVKGKFIALFLIDTRLEPAP